jgi:hypothetical protein
MYPIDENIIYTNDREYADAIVKVFGDDLVDFTTIVDDVYRRTQDNVYFQELYKWAGVELLTEDKSIGMIVLFQFYYFEQFHLLLADFLRDGTLNRAYYDPLLAAVRLHKKTETGEPASTAPVP